MTSVARYPAVTSWLGVLFLLLMVLITVGGVIRLTSHGLAIVGWPLVAGRLLPPVTSDGWHQQYDTYRQRLANWHADPRAATRGPVPSQPSSMAQFRRLYLIRFTHRLMAGVALIIACGCVVTVLRDEVARLLVLPEMLWLLAVIAAQAVIGGVVALTGSALTVLWLHIGLAAFVLSLLLSALLKLLRGPHQTPDLNGRRSLLQMNSIMIAVVWLQIVGGAMVASTRHLGFSSTWPLMQGAVVPPEVFAHEVAWWSNPWLHQWLHRWFAIVVLGICGGGLLWLRRISLGPRARITAELTISLLVVQIVLGVGNIIWEANVLLTVSHLVLGLLLWSCLWLLRFDLRFEPAPQVEGKR